MKRSAPPLQAVVAPNFLSGVLSAPTHRIPELCLGPSPVRLWTGVPELPEDMALFIKREDSVAPCELSGNKTRKLSFLLADAVKAEADVVVTFGTMDSSSCRAVAVACAQIGLPCHLVLVNTDGKQSPNNLLVMRMMGATITILSLSEYRTLGGIDSLGVILRCAASQLRRNGFRNPFVVPVGGRSCVGMWAGVEIALELSQQLVDCPVLKQHSPMRHIIVPMGSATTFAGIGLVWDRLERDGAAPTGSRVRGYCSHNTTEYHARNVARLLTDAGCSSEVVAGVMERQAICDAAGEGYGKCTDHELQFLFRVARETGIALDPTYSNKALYTFVQQCANGVIQPGPSVFIHTGGMFSLLDTLSQGSFPITVGDGPLRASLLESDPTAPVPYVDATITYSASKEGDGEWIVDGATTPPTMSFTLEPKLCRIRNMRRVDMARFEACGFELVSGLGTLLPSDVPRICSTTPISYVDRVLQRIFGHGVHVVQFDVTERSAVPRPGAVNASPVQSAHVDQDSSAALARWTLHAPHIIRADRFLIVNVWRPIGTSHVVDFPLALCDATTVKTNDLVPTKLVSYESWLKDKTYYRVRSNSSHVWFNAPQMVSSEAIAFKIFDSSCLAEYNKCPGLSERISPVQSASACGPVPHCTFRDTAAIDKEPAYIPRSSVEVRSLVFVNPVMRSNV